MSTRNTDEEFEFLLNLLASDGVEPGPDLQPLGAGAGPRIRRGSDGKLDLGQVKAFYEKKNLGVGKEMGKGAGVGTVTDDPGLTDHSRNHSGNIGDDVGQEDRGRTRTDNRGFCVQALETDISVSHFVSEREGQRVLSPLSGGLMPNTDLAEGLQQDSHIDGSASSPFKLIKDPGRWVDLLSEQEAKQLLLEISDGLRQKLPPDNDPRSATDRPRALNEIKNVVEFLVRMDELVWHRSEHGADREVFDPENISAVEERVRLWENFARSYCSEQG